MTDDAAASMEPKVQETKRKRKFVGFSEQLEMKRRERDRRNKPRSWVERKLVVPIVFGIVGYAWYVYIGRFCVPMLRRDVGAMGGRGMGAAFTVVFCLLGMMFWWSYIKLLFTSPGFAKDFVQKTPAPQGEGRRGHGRVTPSASHSHGHGSDSEGWDSDEEYVGGTPYAEISPPATRPPKNEGPSMQDPLADVEKRAGLNIPSAPHRPPAPVARTVSSSKRTHSGGRMPLQVTPKNGTSDTHSHSGGGRNTYETAVSGPQYATNASALPHPLQIDQIQPSSSGESQPPHNSRNVEEGLPPPMYSRRPPTYPALLPEYRYCYTDGLVKPMRAHHCRVCGTCVLMFDHHCPWIGQCVGALNHKFFVNFLQWSTPWTLWIFASLVALQARTASDSGSDVDPQIIVIIALSALFSLFTSVLLAAHIRMIVLNQSNVEALSVSSMRERERAILGRMVPLSDWRRRNVLRKEWDAEWGRLNTEGNMWWLESAHANWEYQMGKNRWGWFWMDAAVVLTVPIGRSEGDGQTYPVNPRFDADGRWRRRSEWPPELR